MLSVRNKSAIRLFTVLYGLLTIFFLETHLHFNAPGGPDTVSRECAKNTHAPGTEESVCLLCLLASRSSAIPATTVWLEYTTAYRANIYRAVEPLRNPGLRLHFDRGPPLAST
jgi:hypothetical protein